MAKKKYYGTTKKMDMNIRKVLKKIKKERLEEEKKNKKPKLHISAM